MSDGIKYFPICSDCVEGKGEECHEPSCSYCRSEVPPPMSFPELRLSVDFPTILDLRNRITVMTTLDNTKENEMKTCKALGMIREARALLHDENGIVSKQTRQLSVVITKLDEAILWRQWDMRLKEPPIDEEFPFSESEKSP